SGAKSLNDLSEESRRTVERLDEIFWKEIFYMQAGTMIKEVNPIGGFEKANSVIDIADKLGISLSDVIYVGDSITDVDPFRLVRAAGGLTISFNGNRYAVREAEIAVMSHHTNITTVLALVFSQFGKEKVLSLVEEWSWETLRSVCDPALFQKVVMSFSGGLPRVEKITLDNVERLTVESSAFRKTVRGEAVAKLG
ncbi:MAG: HAD hydrolase family protein, partial [Candidatus Bathyarchaeia archaeon]